ncbi:hypothetical protein QQ045_026925 [Rhodiola kirilowii]
MAGTHEKAIAVAVKKGRYSQLALKWAVENLTDEGQSLMLVHVRPKSQTFNRGAKFSHYEEMVSVCGEAVAKGLEQSYKDTLNLQVKQMFHPFLSYCKKKNVHCDEVVIDDDDIVQGIADFVLTNNIDLLVIGAGSKGGLFRRLKGPETAQKISKTVPYFCTVYTVAKGGVVSIKSASTAAQTPSPPHVQIKEPEIGIHQQSFTSQMEPRLSAVSASESLFQHGSVREFEFRSPLKNYGDSDFSWEGHAPADSDISFISSDREFFGRVSSNFSTDSSNWSLGSFASRQTSSSTNSTVKSSARSSNAS